MSDFNQLIESAGERLNRLKSGEAHVFLAPTTHLLGEEIESLQASMTVEERRGANAFRFAEDRRDHMVARALLRKALSRYTGEPESAWEFGKSAWGRPFVSGPAAWRRIRFNLTHTRGLVACIVGWNREVGIDAENEERPSTIPESLNCYLSRPEKDLLSALPSELRSGMFFKCWTLKEAYAKARGLGLTLPFERFSVLDPEGRIRLESEPQIEDSPTDWFLASSRPYAFRRLSVAVRRTDESGLACQPRIEYFDFWDLDSEMPFASLLSDPTWSPTVSHPSSR